MLISVIFNLLLRVCCTFAAHNVQFEVLPELMYCCGIQLQFPLLFSFNNKQFCVRIVTAVRYWLCYCLRIYTAYNILCSHDKYLNGRVMLMALTPSMCVCIGLCVADSSA